MMKHASMLKRARSGGSNMADVLPCCNHVCVLATWCDFVTRVVTIRFMSSLELYGLGISFAYEAMNGSVAVP